MLRRPTLLGAARVFDLTVTSERDRVVWVLGSRARDLCLRPDEARAVVAATRESAAECELWERAGGRGCLVTGEPRGAIVKSWDGRVNVRLSSFTAREEIPWRAALALANEIEAKIAEAELRVTVLFQPAEALG